MSLSTVSTRKNSTTKCNDHCKDR